MTYRRRMDHDFEQKMERARLYLKNLEARIKPLSPESRLRENRKYALDLELKLEQRMKQIYADKKHKLKTSRKR